MDCEQEPGHDMCVSPRGDVEIAGTVAAVGCLVEVSYWHLATAVTTWVVEFRPTGGIGKYGRTVQLAIAWAHSERPDESMERFSRNRVSISTRSDDDGRNNEETPP